jgi:hypothetical protein
MSINLHIERLILEGLPASDTQRPLIGAAVETELVRLLATGGLGPSLQSSALWPSLPANAIQLIVNEPAQVGQQIAQAIFKGIGPEQRSISKSSEGSNNVR